MTSDDRPFITIGDTSYVEAGSNSDEEGEDEDAELEIKIDLVTDEQARIRELDLRLVDEVPL